LQRCFDQDQGVAQRAFELDVLRSELFYQLQVRDQVLHLRLHDHEHVDRDELVGCQLQFVALYLDSLPEGLDVFFYALSYLNQHQQFLKRATLVLELFERLYSLVVRLPLQFLLNKVLCQLEAV